MNQPFQFFINSDGQGKATLSFAFPYYSERSQVIYSKVHLQVLLPSNKKRELITIVTMGMR